VKALALVLALTVAGSATATPAVRTAEQRQVLIDLAYVLGQAHALHRVCAGAADDTWRGRMEKLIEVEAPGEAFKSRLSDSFNAGFTAKDAQVKDCKAAATTEAAVARRGSELAHKLAAPAP
jgi:uncharacterized protein (TIGR02301 family)